MHPPPNPRPNTPCCQNNGLGISQCAHPFLLVSFSHCLPSRLLKRAHRCPISGSSLSSYAQSIAHHFFAFIRLTISREWWRHYAIGCNTITSLSHFSVAAKAGTVSSSSVLRQIQTSPHTRGERETHCDFLPLPGNQKSHSGCLATTNYFMPFGSACAGRDHGRVLEKNEDDWQPTPIPQELIRLPKS